MNRFCSMFSQILQLFPRSEFQLLVNETKAERHARGFSCWTQFVSMMFCQLGRAHSLREICHGLSSCEGKLSHLGIAEAPHRTSHGNQNLLHSPRSPVINGTHDPRHGRWHEKIWRTMDNRTLRMSVGRILISIDRTR